MEFKVFQKEIELQSRGWIIRRILILRMLDLWEEFFFASFLSQSFLVPLYETCSQLSSNASLELLHFGCHILNS